MSFASRLAAAVAAVSLAAAPATSFAATTVLGFEDIGGGAYSCCQAVSSYGGLSWSSFYTMGKYNLPGTGYELGTIGLGSIFAYPWGSPTITSATPFTFGGANFTAAWDATESLTLQGYRGGSLVGTVTATLTNTAPTFVTANFADIDELRLTPSHYQVVVDDFTLGTVGANVTATPEPASLALLGGGLVGLGAVARRRRRAR